MEQTFNAILIHPADNVVTVTEELHDGSTIRYRNGDQICTLATSGAPIYHKVAAADIKKGQPVRKYGEIMAVATRDIAQGEHVHTHNVASAVQEREDGNR